MCTHASSTICSLHACYFSPLQTARAGHKSQDIDVLFSISMVKQRADGFTSYVMHGEPDLAWKIYINYI